MKLRKWFIFILLLGIFLSNEAFADTKAIEDRLNALEQEVKILKRQLELSKEEGAKKATEVPIVSASSKDGFSIKSADDSFKLKIRGLVQADGRFFTDNQKDNGTTDAFLVRRARPIFEGTVGKNFDFYLMPDFGSGQNQLVDAYAEFKFSPAVKLRGGKFKTQIGLERLQSDAVGNFVEIGLPANLLPNRDIGFQLSGDLFKESVNYAIGGFNGGADNGSVDTDNNNDKDLIARIFVHPFKNNGPESLKGFGAGVGGSYGHKEGSSLPTYRSTGQASIFSYATGITADGEHIRVSPQAYYYKGALGVIGEYAVSEQKVYRINSGAIIRDTFANKAWQITGNYVLTGELASYKGITPRTNFDPAAGTWGAFEAVGRYGQLDVDDSIFDNSFASISSNVSQADAWGVGLNWYPHKNVKLALDFEQTRFEGGAPGAGDRQTENVILSRFQLSY